MQSEADDYCCFNLENDREKLAVLERDLRTKQSNVHGLTTALLMETEQNRLQKVRALIDEGDLPDDALVVFNAMDEPADCCDMQDALQARALEVMEKLRMEDQKERLLQRALLNETEPTSHSTKSDNLDTFTEQMKSLRAETARKLRRVRKERSERSAMGPVPMDWVSSSQSSYFGEPEYKRQKLSVYSNASQQNQCGGPIAVSLVLLALALLVLAFLALLRKK